MTVAFICSQSPTFVMFWQDTFSSASCQFAPTIGRCKKPPNIVTINGALINTASRFVGMRISGWGIKFPQCGIMCRSPRRRNCASLVNIAHLHVRFARQASERDRQLGATITFTRPQPARLILSLTAPQARNLSDRRCQRWYCPCVVREYSSLGLNVEIERLAGNHRFQA